MVSPASTPGKEGVQRCTRLYESWGLRVELGHLSRSGVPILGGLPIGHGKNPRTVPIGTRAELDADAGTLCVSPAARLA